MRRRSVSFASLLVACGAQPRDEPTPRDSLEPAEVEPVEIEPKSPEPTSPEPPASPPVSAELAPLPEHPGLALGPALAASDAQRSDALLALLSDGRATQLPIVATEPDREFDPDLVDDLAPEPIVTRHVPIPSVELRKPTVGPSYSPDLVRRIVRAHINELRSCYLDELEVAPQTRGKLVVTWTITAEGSTDKVAIASGDVPGDVAKCVTKAIETWKFPKPTHGALEVRYPLEFAAE